MVRCSDPDGRGLDVFGFSESSSNLYGAKRARTADLLGAIQFPRLCPGFSQFVETACLQAFRGSNHAPSTYQALTKKFSWTRIGHVGVATLARGGSGNQSTRLGAPKNRSLRGFRAAETPNTTGAPYETLTRGAA